MVDLRLQGVEAGLQFLGAGLAAIAGLLVQIQADSLGIDFLDRRKALIEAVTLEDVKRAANRLLDPDALTIVAVGRPAGM